ncbi:glutathione S-transferase N-terminal domain-containing protein [Proteinivorax tanatarense]|uniref:Glutathione S-transferase N-terminal domain-containing protein n=1 Tax=Proteinivorax tanatarense TaxID=1260629 RepID=A0AAU7VP29_9FIRM
MKELKLFIMKTCPFCQKVERYMKENNISIEVADIKEDPKSKEELIEQGGKVQVPMLLIDEKPLYESNDIIDWLKENS